MINARMILIILLVLVVIAHFGGVPLMYTGSFGGILLLILVLVLLGVL